MKLVMLVTLLLATAALADVPGPQPATTACVGKQADAQCSATGGRCVARPLRRPDFSTSPPTWGVVEVLLCEEPASSYAFGWAALVGAAGLLALLSRTTRASLRG